MSLLLGLELVNKQPEELELINKQLEELVVESMSLVVESK